MRFSEAFEGAALRELRGFERMQVFTRGLRGARPRLLYPEPNRAELGAWGECDLHPVAKEGPMGFEWLSYGECGHRLHPGRPIVRLHEAAAREGLVEIGQRTNLGIPSVSEVEELMLVALDLTGCVGYLAREETPPCIITGGVPPLGPNERGWYLVDGTGNHCELSYQINRFADVIVTVFSLRRRPSGWLTGVRAYLGGHGFDERRQSRRQWIFANLLFGTITITIHDGGMLKKLTARGPESPSTPLH